MAALRGASQAISYELAMGLSLIAVLMISGSLSLKTIVDQQMAPGAWWNIVYQPLGFILFFICAMAECNRTPFDLPEAENELNMGYHQEYSSMKLGFYLFAEYVNMIMSSAVMASLYFGGYDVPFLDESSLAPNIAAIIGVFSLLTKIVIFLFLFMWIRWTIPRFRYDQLMNLGWKSLIPLALLNMLATGAVILWQQG
jgi:NADH-quinone oxidoreductase subunit H